MTETPVDYLRSIVNRTRDPYTDIALPKRTGGARAISSPDPLLADVQRWVLKNVLNSVELHHAAHAYRVGFSTRTAAEGHVGARWLVKMDLHDFFTTVSERRVYRTFAALGYAPLVSLELARLSTRSLAPRTRSLEMSRRYSVIPTYAVSSLGVLPQGSPTSGVLSNAAAIQLDDHLESIAASFGMVYTRYSDDLTFSAATGGSRDQCVSLTRAVASSVRREGFTPHARKTKIVPPGARKIVLGLLVDERGVRLLPEYKRRIEVHLRGIAIHGLLAHASHRGFDSILGLVRHVEGLLAFAIGIEPEYARPKIDEWARLLLRYGLAPGMFKRASAY